MTLSKTTRDHDEIRRWAEERGAIPAEVRGTERNGEPGILRFEFPNAPNHNDSKLEKIEWDEFFEKFDERGLELVYQDHTAGGAESNFNKLVCPENDKTSHRASGSHTSGSHSSGSKSHKSSDSEHKGKSDHSSREHSTSHSSKDHSSSHKDNSHSSHSGSHSSSHSSSHDSKTHSTKSHKAA